MSSLSLVPSSFDHFWKLYPRKTAKKVAQHCWNRLTDKEQKDAIEALPKHVSYWQSKGTDPEFIPHASTWINQERWEDELPDAQPKQAWWKSEAGVIAEFKRRGKEIPPGKSWDECKAILMQA